MACGSPATEGDLHRMRASRATGRPGVVGGHDVVHARLAERLGSVGEVRRHEHQSGAGTVAALHRYRSELDPELAPKRGRYLTEKVDWLIGQNETPGRRKDELTRALAPEAGEANVDLPGTCQDAAEVEAAVNRIVDHGHVLGLDANIGVIEGESAMLPAVRRARSGDVGTDGKGNMKGPTNRRGSRYEVGVTASLMVRPQVAEKNPGRDRTLELQIESDDGVVMGQKFRTPASGRATVEGDTVIYNGGRRTGIDTKLCGKDEKQPDQPKPLGIDKDLQGQIDGLVEALVDGQLDDFAFVTNGACTPSLRAAVDEANRKIAERVAARDDDLRARAHIPDTPTPVGEDRSDEDDGPKALSVSELSIYLRQSEPGLVPAIWLCPHTSGDPR